MAEKLTPQQSDAVQDRGGKLLVSAAAGSGKTKVLVDRLLSYLTDPRDPAELDQFLIITYTKAAASELRGKIAAKLTERIAEAPENWHLQQQMQRLYLTKISTVHSFCSDLLRENAYRLDLSADFRVGDENECRELREIAMTQVLDKAFEKAGEDPAFRAFVDTQGLGRNDALVPEIIQKVYDSARCHLDPEGWLSQCLENADVSRVADPAQTVWGKYLMEDLFGYLDHQIQAVRRCVEALRGAPGYEKAAALMGDTLYQLERLRESTTWDEIAARKDIDYGRISFPRKDADPELTEQVKAIRSACKKGLEKRVRSFSDPAQQVIADLSGNAEAAMGMIRLVRAFADRYDTVKKARRLLDFGDLEHRALDLLLGKSRSGSTAVARETGRRFREIMVDEYQDSNAVQDAIFGALTEERQNLFMVGDVKQSIYQFRLADPGIFLDKYARFLPKHQARDGQGRKVLLSSNFRSGGAVLSAVNDVFRVCMSPEVGGLEYGPDEALHEGIPHEPLGEPEVELHMVSVREETYPEEAAYVARQIRDLLDGTHMVREKEGLRPITANDIVILLRSPGSVGAHYQKALERLGISCASGGGTDLLQTPEIQCVWSVLQTVSNPRQDIPLIAALTSPAFGFTANDLARIRAGRKRMPMYDALLADEAPKSLEFRRKLTLLRQASRDKTLAGLVEVIFDLTRIDSIYGAMTGGASKAANLRNFFQLAVEFESGGRRDLMQFLNHLDALSVRGIPMGEEHAAGAVTIMSIHKSKGLEFPVVFLCGLSREFNRESVRAQVLCDKELGLGLSCVDPVQRIRYPSIAKRAIAVKTVAESTSEELRVLYVAMTRARDRLVMTYAVKDPAADIQDLVMRSGWSGRELMTADVICPGDWVLYAAVHRMEAGVLHTLGGRPKELTASEHPWKIVVSEAPVEEGSVALGPAAEQSVSPETVRRIGEGLAFRYGHNAATTAPSKQTATALKGRFRDQEAADQAPEPKQQRSWRKASFRDPVLRGKAYGTAYHTAMQYIRFEHCADENAIGQELDRLVQRGLLSPDERQAIRPGKLMDFFRTDLGRKLQRGQNVLREFKFSILDDASGYGDGLEGEKILLQGVVDCALLEEDGIIILDFKTDYVTEENVSELKARYSAQVAAYARALSRIYEKQVKAVYLYSFHLDSFIEI